MARKLKTYQTSLGFFEQAIAAPSMKAALEAWGADSNSTKGRRRRAMIRTSSPRPWRSRALCSSVPWGPTGDSASTPNCRKNLGQAGRKPAHKQSARAKEPSAQPDKAADRKAAQAYERERQRREREEAKEEAARRKERERRQKAVDNAQAALDKAEQEHTQRVAALRAESEAIETKLRAEEADWDKEAKRLKTALRRARD
jgi:hypothetical protein